ncbi:hypothetical protein FACS189490_09690 [Clostridia bacterium]|nr:hypothetical protein FACS189490_09690 [Clostridia bacterium]
MELTREKVNLPIEKSDIKNLFSKLLEAKLLSETEYNKAIERLNSYIIKENS